MRATTTRRARVAAHGEDHDIRRRGSVCNDFLGPPPGRWVRSAQTLPEAIKSIASSSVMFTIPRMAC